MLICTYKLSDEFVKFGRHPLECVDVAYRLPVGSEVHAAVSSECGSPEVKAIRLHISVAVHIPAEIPHTEGYLIAVGCLAVLVIGVDSGNILCPVVFKVSIDPFAVVEAFASENYLSCHSSFVLGLFSLSVSSGEQRKMRALPILYSSK